MRRRKALWITLIVLFVLVGGAFGTLCYFMGGPRDAYGFLRYALPQWHKGDLKVGAQAPDFEAVALDGTTMVRLSDRVGAKPLVLIFGSYT
ncbi:MAG TPA: hypothetical protein VL382_10880 [Terriglobales bacterium]|nr:hypothetical protein [Terriglobales bacterium]